MKRFKFPIAVAITSLALVIVMGIIGVVAVGTALASAPWAVSGAVINHSIGGSGFQLPPELNGLCDLAPAERFSHFVGVQVNLKDKDNQPLTVNVTPGTATAVSATSLTIAANDGTTKTYTLDDKTFIPNKQTQGNTQTTGPSLANGDSVVVVTFNDNTTATAAIDGGKDGFGSNSFGGPPWAHWGHPLPQR